MYRFAQSQLQSRLCLLMWQLLMGNILSVCSVHYRNVLCCWQMFSKILWQISSSPRTPFIGRCCAGGGRRTGRCSLCSSASVATGLIFKSASPQSCIDDTFGKLLRQAHCYSAVSHISRASIPPCSPPPPVPPL